MNHKLIERGGNKLLVFLPSATKREDSPNPYYPRITWYSEMPKDYDCLYIADPFFDQTRAFGGSWFINPDTKQLDLSKVKECIDKYMKYYEQVTLYGSSMGGYAALALSGYGYNKIIADAPQIFLERYPDSSNMLRSFKIDLNSVTSIMQILSSNASNKHISINVNISDYHHTDIHLLPFFSAITWHKRPALHFNEYNAPGHVSMSKEQLIALL